MNEQQGIASRGSRFIEKATTIVAEYSFPLGLLDRIVRLTTKDAGEVLEFLHGELRRVEVSLAHDAIHPPDKAMVGEAVAEQINITCFGDPHGVEGKLTAKLEGEEMDAWQLDAWIDEVLKPRLGVAILDRRIVDSKGQPIVQE